MLRYDVHVRMTFADPAPGSGGGCRGVRRSAARGACAALRLIVAPLALVAAAVAGLLFAVLLPICGIATIAEGVAKSAWRFARGALTHAPHPPPRRI